MRTLQAEQTDLALADRHIRESNERIAAQESRIAAATITSDGYADSVQLLAEMRTGLKEMTVHRALIYEAIVVMLRRNA